MTAEGRITATRACNDNKPGTVTVMVAQRNGEWDRATRETGAVTATITGFELVAGLQQRLYQMTAQLTDGTVITLRPAPGSQTYPLASGANVGGNANGPEPDRDVIASLDPDAVFEVVRAGGRFAVVVDGGPASLGYLAHGLTHAAAKTWLDTAGRIRRELDAEQQRDMEALKVGGWQEATLDELDTRAGQQVCVKERAARWYSQARILHRTAVQPGGGREIYFSDRPQEGQWRSVMVSSKARVFTRPAPTEPRSGQVWWSPRTGQRFHVAGVDGRDAIEANGVRCPLAWCPGWVLEHDATVDEQAEAVQLKPATLARIDAGARQYQQADEMQLPAETAPRTVDHVEPLRDGGSQVHFADGHTTQVDGAVFVSSWAAHLGASA